MESDPLIGRVVGGVYRLEALIGEGGMGRVYRAVHVHTERRFAVKVIGRSLLDGGGPTSHAFHRFKQEAIAASKIDHDGIVQVFSFDEMEDGSPFIVMELFEGESLRRVLSGGPLPPSHAAEIARQVADAVGAAHQAGIVHRDLKPDNIFLVRKRDQLRIKVLDFGIAKIFEQPGGVQTLTRTGAVVGTPAYMSPEQAMQRPIDARSDIYSLGIILYEMLVGQPPFVAPTTVEILYDHMHKAPPAVEEQSPHVDRGLATLVGRMLEKEPGRRPQTMDHVGRSLLGQRVTHDAVTEPLGFTEMAVASSARRAAPGKAALTSAAISASEIVGSVGTKGLRGRRVVAVLAGAGLVVAVIVVVALRPRPNPDGAVTPRAGSTPVANPGDSLTPPPPAAPVAASQPVATTKPPTPAAPAAPPSVAPPARASTKRARSVSALPIARPPSTAGNAESATSEKSALVTVIARDAAGRAIASATCKLLDSTLLDQKGHASADGCAVTIPPGVHVRVSVSAPGYDAETVTLSSTEPGTRNVALRPMEF